MKMRFRLYTYDLIADAEGGCSVNDVYRKGIITLQVRPKVYNDNSPYRFVAHEPSDRQLNQAVGVRGLTWDGESSHTLYANDRNGNPFCELRRLNPDGKEYWDVPKFTEEAHANA